MKSRNRGCPLRRWPCRQARRAAALCQEGPGSQRYSVQFKGSVNGGCRYLGLDTTATTSSGVRKFYEPPQRESRLNYHCRTQLPKRLAWELEGGRCCVSQRC